MNASTRKIAQFGLLTALALVLGWIDRSIPISALLSGSLPGIKLGLANTVLLYAIYLMNWQSAVMLMLVKVLLSGFAFGSLQAIWLSLSGGVLSLIVMLLVRRKPAVGAVCFGLLGIVSEIWILSQHQNPQGEWLIVSILIPIGSLICFIIAFLIKKNVISGVQGTSIGGAVAHNVGQVIAYVIMTSTVKLFTTLLPALIGIGIIVGGLTGIVAERVFRALHVNPGKQEGTGEKEMLNKQYE